MIVTPRLLLRPLREDDLPALTAIYTDPRVMPWIGEQTPASTAEVLAFHVAHAAAHGWAFWAVEERDTGRLLGDCGLQPLELRGAVQPVAGCRARRLHETELLDVAQHPRRPPGGRRGLVDRQGCHRRQP